MANLPQFSEADLAKLDVSADKEPNSGPVADTLRNLREELGTVLQTSKWGRRYLWREDFQTPYIGPGSANSSSYVWLGMADEHYTDIPRASNVLQIEFGVDAGSATGFLGQSVIWGILLGPWADENVVDNIAKSLETYSSFVAQFLTENDEYVLLTEDHCLDAPDEGEIKQLSSVIDQGFTITRDLELTDITSVNITELAMETLTEITPLYRVLAGIENADSVSSHQGSTDSISQNVTTSDRWNIDSLSRATTLDTEEIEDDVNRLVDANRSHQEAIEFERRYLKQMLEGRGLFALHGVGSSRGAALVDAGVTTVEELRAATPRDVANKSNLSTKQVQYFQRTAQANNFSSYQPDDWQVANQLLDSSSILAAQNPKTEASSCSGEQTNEDVVQSGDAEATGTPESENKSGKPTSQTSDDRHKVLTPRELLVPDPEEYTVPGGGTLYPNHLSEYCESFCDVREVLDFVFRMPQTDIVPDNRRDPRVQYFILIDACIGFSDMSTRFAGYGPQHQDRLSFSAADYYKVFGDTDTITDYQYVNVKPFEADTHELLRQSVNVDAAREYVRPCVPGTGRPVPELPGSFAELQDAMLQLSAFPAYPPLPSENGVNDRTIPIADIYRACFEDLDRESQVDLSPLETTDSQPTGPVSSATPTSPTEVESKLVDYGRLSHLFRRVTPPSGSPVNQKLNVIALDWYRPGASSFDAIQTLAKHQEGDSIETFRPRLRDLINRRFLRDNWEYDYITVYPGHEAGSRNSQLVELARDAMLETEVIYTPLLERTKTTERQREKSAEERQSVAYEPSESLRAQAKLRGDTVILFDDICTTGSSLFAGSYLLRQAGADRVVCVTLGFTPGRRANIKEISDPEATVSEIVSGVDQ